MTILSSAQTSDGYSDSNHTHPGGIGTATVTETVKGDDPWKVDLQFSDDGGTTWKHTGVTILPQSANRGHGYVLPANVLVRSQTQALDGSTLKIVAS